jgi:pimeloyl-ACP methyl ester carboxylesterase
MGSGKRRGGRTPPRRIHRAASARSRGLFSYTNVDRVTPKSAERLSQIKESAVWVSRHPLNNSLAVFVHGIWGSRWATWRSHLDFFQRIYKQRPALTSFDIYFFHYKTGIQQPPLYPVITKQLKEFLDKEGGRYDTVVLVCHSQGGIVGRRLPGQTPGFEPRSRGLFRPGGLLCCPKRASGPYLRPRNILSVFLSNTYRC